MSASQKTKAAGDGDGDCRVGDFHEKKPETIYTEEK